MSGACTPTWRWRSLREVQQTVRDDLILIVMSATLEAEPVAAFPGGCPIVRAEGRTFPVEIAYHRGARRREQPRRPVWHRMADADRIDRVRDGDVLAFLPGAEEIRSHGGRDWSGCRRSEAICIVLPLHGSLPSRGADAGAAAGFTAEDHPGDEHRGDVADD